MKIKTESRLPTKWGSFRVVAYGESETYSPDLALISGDISTLKLPLVRIHSECMTGDVFGSSRCDCGPQLAYSMQRIGESGGVLVYLRQEGRGIGLIEKLKAYNLQDQGLDTAEANVQLGHQIDDRSFEKGIEILLDLAISRLVLLTNNPDKIESIRQSTIELVDVEPVIISPNEENYQYLLTKQERMGHHLHLNGDH